MMNASHSLRRRDGSWCCTKSSSTLSAALSIPKLKTGSYCDTSNLQHSFVRDNCNLASAFSLSAAHRFTVLLLLGYIPNSFTLHPCCFGYDGTHTLDTSRLAPFHPCTLHLCFVDAPTLAADFFGPFPLQTPRVNIKPCLARHADNFVSCDGHCISHSCPIEHHTTWQAPLITWPLTMSLT